MVSLPASSTAEPVSLGQGERAGVCLFRVAGRRYAVSTAVVGEVTSAAEVLPVPMVPAAVVGLFNLRGTPVAVIDLRVLLGECASAEATPPEGLTLLVLRTDHPVAALRVDRLEAVLPAGAGRMVLLDEPGAHPARVGVFEPPASPSPVTLLGAGPLVASVLKLGFGENADRRHSA